MTPRYIGIIGDIVNSKNLSQDQRFLLQNKLSSLLNEMNEKYSTEILSKFIITTGDEFQGLLKIASVLPSIIWEVEEMLAPINIRFGVGRGELYTEVKANAIAMDGPVWHKARAAVVHAHEKRKLGGVFRGFGSTDDIVLSGLAQMLNFMRGRLTEQQRKVVSELNQGLNHEEIAKRMKISRQAVSKHADAASWKVYRNGEDALRVMLGKFDKKSWRKYD